MSPAPQTEAMLVPAVDRAAQILRVLAASDTALGVSELSRQLGLNKSTTHAILATLCHHHLLERNDSQKTYHLGYGLAELGRHVHEGLDLRAIAHPHLVELSRAVEETVFLGTFHDGHVTIVDKAESPHAVKITSPLGHRIHYSAAAFGKVFLAAMPTGEINTLIRQSPLRAHTAKSITKTTAFRTAIALVRQHGYALDDEEYLAGVRATAAPINDEHGHVIAALCVVGFSTRLPKDQLQRVAKQTCEFAEQISRQLGNQEYPQWNGVA